VESEPILERADINEIKWLLADILNELKDLRKDLEDGEEEEAD
jgi:hypothetical protein